MSELDDYIEIYDIHPDWKDGECRKCGEYLPNRVHKDVQVGVEPAQTTCRECLKDDMVVRGVHKADATVRL